MQFRDIAARAAADGVITADEILELRRAGWSDGLISPEEAESIFAANDQIAEPTREWTDFFVEALGEFIVNTLEPRGYVTLEQADWLVARIDHDGKTESMTELELLVKLFEKAQDVPQSLRDYALGQIESWVLTDHSRTSHHTGHESAAGVSEPEARLLRRFIFASGSDRPAAVSRAEAEMLYRIKDAALDKVNAPEWKRLFVQGVGNYLMGFTSHTSVTRDRAAELDAFMNDRGSSLGGFLGRMAKSTFTTDFYGNLGEVFGGKDKGTSIDDRVADARNVDVNEATWLEGELDGNGRIDEYDQALLAFLREESGFTR